MDELISLALGHVLPMPMPSCCVPSIGLRVGVKGGSSAVRASRSTTAGSLFLCMAGVTSKQASKQA